MNNTDKPRYRWNHKTNKWDELFRLANTFIFIDLMGNSRELPLSYYDTYKDIFK